MAPAEAARVTAKNLSSLSSIDVTKAQTALDRTLRRRLRNPALIDVTLTVSENVQGFLFVAEIRRGTEHAVEMVEYHPDAPAARATVTIEKKLIWEQAAPILDVEIIGEDIPRARHHFGDAVFELRRLESAGIVATAVRDPRGRLQVEGDLANVFLPTATARNVESPN